MARSLFDKLAPHVLKRLSDEQYLRLSFMWHQKRLPRLHAPLTFNEKMLWLQVHYRDALMVRCADKYLVREYVRERISDDILVPLLGVYKAPGEIPFSTLPDSFILKATHGSGWNIVCRSRSTFDIQAASAKLSKHLRTNYYSLGREWVYRELTPRIICEALLLDADGEIPPDYKFHCCHGEPAFIQVDFNRLGAHTRNLYDLDWRLLPYRYNRFPNNLDAGADAPAALPSMLRIARQLSQAFPLVRVDLYAVGRQVFFGELTFFSGRSMTPFRPREFDYQLGRLIDLDSIRAHIE